MAKAAELKRQLDEAFKNVSRQDSINYMIMCLMEPSKFSEDQREACATSIMNLARLGMLYYEYGESMEQQAVQSDEENECVSFPNSRPDEGGERLA